MRALVSWESCYHAIWWLQLRACRRCDGIAVVRLTHQRLWVSVLRVAQRPSWQSIAAAGAAAIAVNLMSSQMAFAEFKLPPIDSGGCCMCVQTHLPPMQL